MASNLIFPRVECYWGKTNLTFFSEGPFRGNPQPLVYNIQVELQDGGQNPSGGFQWNASGPGFQVYQEFISDKTKIQEEIVIRFFYANGKSIPFFFVWSGQRVRYGTDMSVSVILKTTMDGRINANPRSIAQPNDEPKSILDHVSWTTDQFGMAQDLVNFSEEAQDNLKKAKLNSYYGKDISFGKAIDHLVKQNGNYLINSNVGGTSVNVFTPHTFGTAKKVLEAPGNLQMTKSDMTKCYGYILGPGLFEYIERTSEWQPPQMTTTDTTTTQTKPTEPKPAKLDKKTQTPTTSPQAKVDETATPTTAPLGTSGAKANPGVSNANNPDGPAKQIALQQENSSKVTIMAFMCPVLTGIKPGDMVYIPSLKTTGNGDFFMEDWIVDGVGYDQTDGGVILTINGHRTYGLGTLMQPAAAKPFIEKAKSFQTLEAWQAYAWPPMKAAVPASSTSPPISEALLIPATPKAQAEMEFSTTRTAEIG
jgi:hypothetical protein